MRAETVPMQWEKTTAPARATKMQKMRSPCVAGTMSPASRAPVRIRIGACGCGNASPVVTAFDAPAPSVITRKRGAMIRLDPAALHRAEVRGVGRGATENARAGRAGLGRAGAGAS